MANTELFPVALVEVSPGVYALRVPDQRSDHIADGEKLKDHVSFRDFGGVKNAILVSGAFPAQPNDDPFPVQIGPTELLGRVDAGDVTASLIGAWLGLSSTKFDQINGITDAAAPNGAVLTKTGTDAYAFQELALAPKRTTGATVPVSPSDGDEHYWTGADKHEWFYYDGPRSRWLSRHVREIRFSKAVSEGPGYIFTTFGGPGSATYGHLMVDDMAIVHGTAIVDGTVAGLNFDLYEDGVVQPSANLDVDGVTSVSQTMSIFVAKGTVLACQASVTCPDPHLITWFAHRTVS